MRRLVVTFIILITPLLAFSQELESKSAQGDGLSNAQEAISTDSSKIAADSVKVPVGDIKTTVNYKAKDSINFNLKTQDIIMYKKSHVDYGDIELDADKIKVNYATKILDAEGIPDTTGKMVGKPIFTDKGQVYQTEEITYNFDTRRAIIKGVVTQQGEAFMHSEWIKKNENDELFGHDALYTTCNLEHPHFGIAASKIKLIPNDKILAGPFHLEINEIPTPFLFPFGMFPMPNTKTSGILFPTYGEEKTRGFFLRNGGYYWAINEFIDLAVMGDIYSKGSYGLSAATTYKKRYSYSGSFSLRYNLQKGIESEIDSSVSTDFWVNWSHRPQSKGTGRFSASVQGGSNSYNQNNPTGSVDQFTRQKFNSTVSYSNVIPNSPFNYAISARHDQNVSTKEINILLPEVALNMNRQYPFKNVNVDNLTWLKKINYSYNFASTNKITNNIGVIGDSENDSIAEFSFDNMPLFLKNADNGGKHTIPIATSFSALKFITVNPNFNYTEYWYLKELNHRYDTETQSVVIDTLNQFSRASSFNAGIGFNTILYGMVYPKIGSIEAIRHVMTPSVNFSWRPDFGDEKYGIYNEVQTDSLGNTKIYSKYEGFVYGSPSRGRSANIGLSLSNVVEMKVKAKNDTAEAFKKIKILDNFSLNAGYNLLADSFKLSDINMSVRTKIFNGKLDLNLQSTLSPYVIRLDSVVENNRGIPTYYQTREDQYTWQAGQGLGRFTRVTVAASTNLNPRGKDSDDEKLDNLEQKARTSGASEDQVQELLNNPDLYVDFDIPWNLRVNYNITWSRAGYEEPKITQVLNFNGDINFTENWKVSFRSGYDIVKQDFTTTSFSIFRNLHCWQINANWIPFGRAESFSVDIGVKASILQDLKLNRRRNWTDR